MKILNAEKINKVLIKIGVSKIISDQVGLIAVRNIEKGTLIADAKKMGDDFFCNWKEYEKIDRQTKDIIDAYCLGDEKGFYLMQDLNYLSIPWHMNHSCNPNVGFDDNDNFVSIKKIKKGEEMTWDYAFGETNPNFKMKCECKSKKCRKIITGKDFLDVNFYKKNNIFFISKLRKK